MTRPNQWSETFAALSESGLIGDLSPEDLERLSTAAFMLGRIDDMMSALETSHRAYLERGDLLPAVRAAVWMSINLASADQFALASGWLERAERLLEPVDEDRVERGYMLLPTMFKHIAAHEYEAAAEIAAAAADIGRRFGDVDLVAHGVHAQARAHIRQGKIREALRLLDEVMVSVTAEELSPMATGLVYCSAIEGCFEIFEIRRAAEWTMALSAWCDAQPDLVAFTDQCLAHRAEIMQLQGVWPDALEQTRRTRDRKSQGMVAAQAYYQQAEIHRLWGKLAVAEEDYHNVSLNGGDPQPGLARLRLAQGKPDAAAASLSRALSETTDMRRLAILPAYIDVMVAIADLAAARRACEELDQIAEQTNIDMHRAWAAYARGLVDLSEGNPAAAIPHLRGAFKLWLSLSVPHEVARTRTVLGMALFGVGDKDAAHLELSAARAIFARLGATPEVLEVDSLTDSRSGTTSHYLTLRELEVLRLLASGATNRSIAEKLVVSERTIDRHVSNIFAKLGVSTRSAATSYAHRHRLV